MRNDLEKILFLAQLEEYNQERISNWFKKHSLAELAEDKKQLVWTPKAKTIFTFSTLLTVLGIPFQRSLFLTLKIISLLEFPVKQIVILLAKVKLFFYPNLMVIGITGSYGKTSVKEVLYQVLSSKYQVLKTPENYNTPLGIALVILQQLRYKHQIFIVEMGAYKKGDIKTICNLVCPKIGILTAIGKQHLERFGNVENIVSTKYELLASLPKKGIALLNGNNSYCVKLAKNLKIKTIIYAKDLAIHKSLIINHKSLILAATIVVSQNGSSFEISYGGEEVKLKTLLLGTHNVLNTLPAIAIARELGISWNKIITAVSSLFPLPHRLQPIKGANETLIIDDSYNANPDSVKAALEVLKEIDSPRKIVITPGLVELGKEQEKENELFGSEIAKVADYLIIVGNTNKNALRKGFDTVEYHSRLVECSTLAEATEKLQQIVIPKSVILFSNDLPDQYL